MTATPAPYELIQSTTQFTPHELKRPPDIVKYAREVVLDQLAIYETLGRPSISVLRVTDSWGESLLILRATARIQPGIGHCTN